MSTETETEATTEQPKSFWRRMISKPSNDMGEFLKWSFAWMAIPVTAFVIGMIGFWLIQVKVFAHYTDFSSFRWYHVLVVLLVTVVAFLAVRFLAVPKGILWVPVLLVGFLLISYLDLFGFNWARVIIVGFLALAAIANVKFRRAPGDVFAIPVIVAVFVLIVTFWTGASELVWSLAVPETGLLRDIGALLRHMWLTVPLVVLLVVAGLWAWHRYGDKQHPAYEFARGMIVCLVALAFIGLCAIGFIEGLMKFVAIGLNFLLAGLLPFVVLALGYQRSIYKLDADGRPIREDDETDEVVEPTDRFDDNTEPIWTRPDGTEVPESATSHKLNWWAWGLMLLLMYILLLVTGMTVEVTN